VNSKFELDQLGFFWSRSFLCPKNLGKRLPFCFFCLKIEEFLLLTQNFWSCQFFSAEEPERDHFVSDEPCDEDDMIMDAFECELAAADLDEIYNVKLEDKSLAHGCVLLPEGLGSGVYYNAHEEAPERVEDSDWVHVCKFYVPEPTETEEPTTTTKEPTTTTEEPVCGEVCAERVDDVEDDIAGLDDKVSDMEENYSYLMNDVPEILANQFIVIADLQARIEQLEAELARVSGTVDEHDDKFSCLAN